MTFTFVRRNDLASDGTAPIYFFIRHNGKTYKVPTGEKCSTTSKAWNTRAQSVSTKFNGASQTNQNLDLAKAEMKTILKSLTEFDIDIIREQFKQYLENKNQPQGIIAETAILQTKGKKITEFINDQSEFIYWTKDEEQWDFKAKWTTKYHKHFSGFTPLAQKFYGIVECVMHEHRNEWSPDYKRKMRTMRTKLIGNIHDPLSDKRRIYEGMDEEFSTSKISLSWWQDYVDYCFDELENEHNTVQTDLKVLHHFCNIIRRRKIPFNENIFHASMSYIEPRIEPLDWKEVKLIADVDLSSFPDKGVEDVRYLWVAAAYLGQRWKDIKRMTKHSFIDKDIAITTEDGSTVTVSKKFYSNRQQKTKKLIEIPLLDEAVEWLSRREFALPELSNAYINRCIKLIVKHAGLDQTVTRHKVIKDQVIEEYIPKWQTIHIHTARHSFAVEMVKRSIGQAYYEKFVAEMLGHASMQTTWKYINFVSSQKDQLFFHILKGATSAANSSHPKQAA
jgi:integrase